MALEALTENSNFPGKQRLLWMAAIALAMPLTSFRRRLVEDAVTVDGQILLRILPLALLACWLLPRAFSVIRSGSVTSLLYTWLFFLVSRACLVFIAPSPLYGGLFVYYLVTATIVILGVYHVCFIDPMWWKSLLSCYLFVLIGIGPIVWLIDPAALWFMDFGENGRHLFRYCGGLTHPFVTSELACACIGFVFIRSHKWHHLFWLLAGLTLFVLSMTRTWILASAVAVLFIIWFRKIVPRWVIVSGILIITISLVAIEEMSFSGGVTASTFTRSGSVNEIITLTGRTKIWGIVLDVWQNAPFFGYGSGSSRWILYHCYGTKLTHAHNLWLQILLEGGIFLFMCVMLFVMSYAKACRQLLGIRDDQRGIFFLYVGIAILIASVTTNPGILSCSVSFVMWFTIAITHTCPGGVRKVLRW